MVRVRPAARIHYGLHAAHTLAAGVNYLEVFRGVGAVSFMA